MKHKSGFTLMELLVVIGIIAILSAISVPLMSKWKARHEFTGDLQGILMMFRLARTVAVEENETVVVSIDDAGSWQAFVDDGGGDATDDNGLGHDGAIEAGTDGVPDLAQNRTLDAGERVVASGVLSESVSITSGDLTLLYDNRGYPVNSSGGLITATITLASSLGGDRDIRIYQSGYSAIQ